MPPPSSDLFQICSVRGAGRGVLASDAINKGTELLACPEPAAHVIFREYRKEVCAQCFHYDRGRTLSIRSNDLGKVFCSQTCQSAWTSSTSDRGLEAWHRVTAFINTNSKRILVVNEEQLAESKPTAAEVSAAWADARTIDGRWAKHRKNTAIYPDVLGFLLSAILTHCENTQSWDDAMNLAPDQQPYKTSHELDSHCQSFRQLLDLLPAQLIPSCTEEVCLKIFQAGSHNAFGIRSGGEDAEEYLGYAIYPQASYFNHSCKPNVSKKRINRTWHFYAADEVQPHQELCISYLGGDEKDMGMAERRARLYHVWEFTCQCRRCVTDSLKDGISSIPL